MPGKNLAIKASDNKEFNGYLAKPKSGKGPGLLLIQEIFGVNSHIRDVADLYAMDGFVVLAPDLFWRIKPHVELGYSEADLQEGIGYAQKLDFKQTLIDLSGAARELKAISGASKIGAIGYCKGGLVSYLLAANHIVDAAVSYYGGGIDQHLDLAPNVKCPVLMHFADQDHFITTAIVEKIKEAFKSKPNVEIILYEGVDHGFNCDQRSAYDRKTAMLAYGRSATFLHRNLD